MRKILKTLMVIGLLIAGSVAVYALANHFLMTSQKSNFTKKDIFEFNLSTKLAGGEIGPNSSFEFAPKIYNDATEEMYVFISIEMPLVSGNAIYSYEIDNQYWVEVGSEVEGEDGTFVYAYATEDGMVSLNPGEESIPLTQQMSMISMENYEYAQIDDINFTVTGYAISIEDLDPDPSSAWNICKEIRDSTNNS